MPPSNWCKLHSQAVRSDVFQDADLWRFWCYILMRTSRNGNVVIMHGQQLKLNPGQCVIGRKQAARDCYTTEQRVRTMINHLKSMENITTESTNRCTVVTVCNWEGYQSGQPIKQPAEQPANQPTANQQTTNRQPAANHNLEVQREKKEKKKRDTPQPPKGGKRRGGFKTWKRSDLEKDVAKANHDGLLTEDECKDFVEYWCEPSSSGRFKFTLNSTWDTRHRMQAAFRMIYEKQRTDRAEQLVSIFD